MRLIVLMPLVLLAACAASPEPTPEAILGGVPNMANPASVYCAKVGGKLEIRSEAAGEVGYCHLPDGRVIEEWALFRQENTKK